MDLVKAARKGRQVAFQRLFEQHHAPLFRFAYRLTGSVPDAEDIVQHCFLQLLRPECGYDPARANLRSYLFGVVRNQALKRMRGKGSASEREEESTALSPERALLRSELADAVAKAVHLLPDSQRDIVILAHYERIPLAEIAQMMSLDLGAVKSRLQRARANLKETLAVYATDLERKG